jgi:hypothetical protein
MKRLAWLAPLLSFALGLGGNVLVATVNERLPRVERIDAIDILFSVAFVAFAVVGALIASRHPRNPVGWLFCGFGVLYPAVGMLYSYAVYGVYATADGLPGQELAAWVFAWSGELSFVPVILLLLLFPDGRFLTRRWRAVGIAAVANGVLFAVGIGFDPGPLYTFETIANPYGVEAAGDSLEVLIDLGSVVMTLMILTAGTSLVVRYRRVDSTERQQIKWLAAGAATAAILVLTFSMLELTTESDRGLAEAVTSVLALLSLVVIPVTAGIAMLRHRLYDVDLVINRAVVYGALTATLLGSYLAGVLLLQLALSPLTEDNGLAIAGSTLAAAALFRPARARIQAIVDRRFYRHRYDAAQTVERFGARLRDQVELEALSADLRAVVADTVQPAHVSIWLKEAHR